MLQYNLPHDTHIGSVQLQVSDLKTALAFYQELLGFQLYEKTNNKAFLSANGISPALLVLVSNPAAKPKETHTTGLYHFAIRLPNRSVMGALLIRLLESQWPIYGGSDHLVSEALYLADQDGNGIEIYIDRPRESWPIKNGMVDMVSEPLDFRGLINAARENDTTWRGIHPETDIGHIHLQVSDLLQSEKFYNQVLGLEVTQRNYPGALFLAAGGYHHHIGLNTWNSKSAPPSSADHIGLIAYELRIPDGSARQELLKRLTKSKLTLTEPFIHYHPDQIMVSDPDSIHLLI